MMQGSEGQIMYMYHSSASETAGIHVQCVDLTVSSLQAEVESLLVAQSCPTL